MIIVTYDVLNILDILLYQDLHSLSNMLYYEVMGNKLSHPLKLKLAIREQASLTEGSTLA